MKRIQLLIVFLFFYWNVWGQYFKYGGLQYRVFDFGKNFKLR